MKKSDLRTGMQIQFNNGMRAVVLIGTMYGDVFCSLENSVWGTLNMEDVIKVFECMHPDQYIHTEFIDDHIIWERTPEKTYELDGVEYSESTLRSLIKRAQG